MKIQPINLALACVNLVLLVFLLSRGAPLVTPNSSQVLRARGLEIVDAQGRLRAQIIVAPPTTLPDGREYPETTLLRLIDPNGRPSVKIGTSVDGTAMSLEGDSEKSEWSGVQILADGTGSSVKLTNKDGSQQLIEP